jgi:hypothetical protein
MSLRVDAKRIPMNGIWRWLSFLRHVGWPCLILATTGCADPNGRDPRDHAIDTCFPSANVQSIAESRAKNFWARNATRFPDTKLLAVEGTTTSPSNDIYPKLLYSETGAVDFFSHGLFEASYSELSIFCILIYDTQTGRLVSTTGYDVVDLPPRESVTRFGPYTARYIGTGWGL